MPISLAGESQNGVWPSLDPAVDQTGKVHSQKWKFWIWNRIDQVSHQVLPIGTQLVILTAERDDLHGVPGARFAGNPVTVQSGTVNNEIRFVFAAGRLNHPCAGFSE